jgi:hypothetical protein
MKTSSWLKSLRNRVTSGVGRRTIHRKPRLNFDTLEDRVVPATPVYFDDFATGIAVDTGGNQYVNYSRLHGTIDLDPDPARTSWVTGLDPTVFGGLSGQFLVKYSPSREVLWVKSGADMATFVRDIKIAADPGGSEYLYKFGSDITKLDLDGNVIWTNGMSNASVGNNYVDVDGSIYATGSYSATVDLDTSTVYGDNRDLLTAPATQAMYIAKWDANGNVLWSQTISSTATSAEPSPWVGGGPVTVANGIVYVGGGYRGTLSLGGLTNDQIDSASTSPDGFLAAYDANGNYQSVAHFVDATPGIVRAAGSDVYLTAGFGYTTDLDPGAGQNLLTPGSINGANLAVARLTYDNSGPTPIWTLNWAEKFVSTGENGASGLAVSGTDLFVSGIFGTTTDFDPSAGTYNLTAGGEADIFAMKLNASNGGLAWVTQMGSTRRLAVNDSEDAKLVLTPTGIYLGGNVAHGTVNFVGTDRSTVKIMDSGLDKDGFVAKLGIDGSYQWSFGVGAVGRTMDDGDPGYTEAGSGWKNLNIGWDSEARTHSKGTGTNTATWTFTGLPNGTYQVITRFPASNKNASNAPFRVNGTLVPVNETIAPNDIAPEYLEGVWENLGTFAVTNGTLTVVLSDAANGTVVADVVRTWFVAPPAPLMAASAPTGTPAAGTLSPGAVKPLMAEALRRWHLVGADTAALGKVDVRIGDLSGNTLGLAQGHTISLDTNAAGWGWFVDRTSRSDAEFTTAGNQGEQGRMDLLSVLMHEVGHLLGHGHDADGLMGETLATGIRENPAPTIGSAEQLLLGAPTANTDHLPLWWAVSLPR